MYPQLDLITELARGKLQLRVESCGKFSELFDLNLSHLLVS